MNTEELSIAEWEGISCCHPVSCQEMEAFLEGIVDKQQTLQVPVSRPNVMASIARDEAFLLMEYIMRHPGAYLREAVHYLENICGRELSLSSVRRCFGRRDFTRKNVRQR